MYSQNLACFQVCDFTLAMYWTLKPIWELFSYVASRGYCHNGVAWAGCLTHTALKAYLFAKY